MSVDVQPIDISDSGEILDLAEDVRRTGIGRLLRRGEQDLALLIPISSRSSRRPSRRKNRDALLTIIGLGASAEPTDIARDKQESLAEAYAPDRQ